ncbi:MAG TPA: glycoside hydrolase family 3 N-terminal domain-containing protein [Acidimicrobiales bacterium]
MRKVQLMGVAIVLTSLGVTGFATITSATSTTSSLATTTSTPTTTTTVIANLACATKTVATWSLVRQANETVSVSVNALDIGAMGPAATAGYGGILLFGTTAPAKFSSIVATLQGEALSKHSMLVMTDQEGGGVERLTNLVATLPWAQTMGKNLSDAQITSEGRRVGASMKAAGINTDLAPVLDVDGRAQEPGAANPDGYRSFSGVPSKAASDGVAFLNGLRSAHITSVVKHFPGLGHATGNTDYGPAATLPWATLKTTGLVPFQAAINDGVTAVMLSNATIPGFTSLPSSISPNVIQYLRQHMGFTGLIVTDVLSAGALSLIHLGVPAASVKALEAGADLVLAGSPASPAASLHLALLTSNAIQKAVTSGALSQATLDAAAAQVLASENPSLIC